MNHIDKEIQELEKEIDQKLMLEKKKSDEIKNRIQSFSVPNIRRLLEVVEKLDRQSGIEEAKAWKALQESFSELSDQDWEIMEKSLHEKRKNTIGSKQENTI